MRWAQWGRRTGAELTCSIACPFGEIRNSIDAKLQVDTQRHVCGTYSERCSAESAFYSGPLTSVCANQLKSLWFGIAHYRGRRVCDWNSDLKSWPLCGGTRIHSARTSRIKHKESKYLSLAQSWVLLCGCNITFHYVQFPNYISPFKNWDQLASCLIQVCNFLYKHFRFRPESTVCLSPI